MSINPWLIGQLNTDEKLRKTFYFNACMQNSRRDTDTSSMTSQQQQHNTIINAPQLSRRVLIVDDDIVTRKTLSNFLRKLGFKVVTAEGASQSLKILHINAYLGELARQKRLSVDEGSTAVSYPSTYATNAKQRAAQTLVTERRHSKLQRAIETASQEEQNEAEEISEDDIGGEFDLLLIDVMMPDIDGIELLKIFKKASTQDIPIIMISSSEDPDVISQSFISGAEDFLAKPIRFDILKRRVEMCLEDRTRRKQESRYRAKLQEEREKRDALTLKVQEQKQRLEQLRASVETPMQVVIKTISDLTKGSHSIEQYKGALLAIMKSFGVRDMYRPTFSSILEHEDSQIDDATKKWLATEFMPTIDQQRPISQEQKEKWQPTRRKSSLPENVITHSTFISLDSQHCFDEKGQLKNTITDLDSFTFNVFAYDEDELILNVAFMFEDLGLMEKFSLDRRKMLVFLQKVRRLYRNNPYHNFTHAVDVTQFCYACLCLERIAAALLPLDIMALLLASICHDIDHPGVNNNYQVSAKTELALMYNDMSVLENYHCATLFQLLRKDKYSFVSAMPREQFKEMRKYVISSILATDMAHHFEISTKFQTRLQSGPLNKEHSDDRQMLVNIILKCADISNVVRPFDVCHRWADMLIEEFANQGDREQAEGMPISPNMDRTQIVKPKFQISFIDFIAAPLYKNMAGYVVEMQPVVSQLSANRSVWEMKLRQETQLPTLEAVGMEEKGGKEEEEETAAAAAAAEEEEDSYIMPIQGDFNSVGTKTAKLKGFKVLAIEESTAGGTMLTDLLSKDGFHHNVVRNGQEAIEISSKLFFDIVLVDAYPSARSSSSTVMGDFEAIRHIRKVDREHKRSTPIIVLTPESKYPEVIELSKKHAVDACLIKPVPMHKLVSTIENLIAAATENYPVVDIDLAAEQCGGELEFVEELLGDFIEHGSDQIRAIELAIADRNWDSLQLNAHSIKGAAAQLAAKPTSQTAFSLEKAAKQMNDENLEHDLNTLKERFAAVTEYVNTIQSD